MNIEDSGAAKIAPVVDENSEVKKLLRAKITRSELKDFKKEAELMLGLRHPNIVQIIGGGHAR